jgi:hypothetical protein
VNVNLGVLGENIRSYLEVLTRLWKSALRKRFELWTDKWILHHHNAPGHNTLIFHEFLAVKSITKWAKHLSYLTSVSFKN